MAETPHSDAALSLPGVSGRRVLITAGAAGIGLTIARHFLRAGAQVFVTDVNPQAVETAAAEGFHSQVADSSSEEAVQAVIATADDAMGGIDVLINNAGVAGPTGPIETLGTEAWKKTFDVNIHSQFYAIKHGLPALRRSSRDAIIINLSSAAGRLGMAGRSAYSASKWAVIGLTKTLAIELGPENIRVNAICPGAVNGARIQTVIEQKAQMLQKPLEEVGRLYHEQASLGRLVEAEDIASTALYLASNLSRSVHGQAVAVDGHTEKLY